MNTPNHEPKPEDGQNIFLDPFAEPEETDLGHIPEQFEEAAPQLPPSPDQIEKPDEDTPKPESAPKPEDSVSVFSKIEERKAYLAQNPNKKGKLTKRIAVGATALLGLTGAALGIGLNSSSEPEEGGAPQAQEATANNGQESSAEHNNPAPTTPETDATTGNIRTVRILENEPLIELERPNGEKIEVPRLRTDQNLETEEGRQLFMESAFALIACYTTLGNEASANCLNEFSEHPGTQAELENTRSIYLDNINVYYDTYGEGWAPEEDWQLSVYDNPSNPARFTYEQSNDNSGKSYIELSEGEIFTNIVNHPVWQSPETHTPDYDHPLNSPVEDFRLELENSANGEISITNIQWNVNR